MEETHGTRKVIDIGKTTAKHSQLASFLPAAHALTGSDSTSKIQGIGKKTALKSLNKSELPCMGIIDAGIDDVIKEATRFIGICYGIEEGSDMTFKRWKCKLKICQSFRIEY